jgi:AraC-like DNA-binding protein
MNSVGEKLELRQIELTRTWPLEAEGKHLCFFYLRQGKCKYLAEEVSHVLSSGDWLVFTQNRGATMSPVEKKPASAACFLVSLEHLSSLLGLREIGLLETVCNRLAGSRHVKAASPVAQQCHGLLESTPATPGLEHRGQLLRIVATILSDEFKQAREQEGNEGEENGDFTQVIKRLTLEDVQNLSVEELAKKLGYSRRHLNRLFHEQVGISVSELKMEARLLKSLCLLKNTNAKVIDVALECGFNHLGLFSHCFKRRFAVSPNQWRRREMTRGRDANSMENSCLQDCRIASNGMCLWNHVMKSGNAPVSPGGACNVSQVNSRAADPKQTSLLA